MLATFLHILPQDGVGGAEIAARSAANANSQVHLLFATNTYQTAENSKGAVHEYAPTHTCFSWASLSAGMRAYKRINPDVVVFSLWKSLPLFLLLRVRYPRLNIVLMLHSAKYVHVADYLATSIMQLFANAVWGDSESALRKVWFFNRKRARVVSFVTKRPDPKPITKTLSPSFIYWGRLAEVKNLPEVIRLFDVIAAKHPAARLTLIGPDDGEQDALQTQIAELGLSDVVHFAGHQSWAQIAEAARDHSFFIQLSIFEGMAMSVVEAMQLGLVPVVTPVGEIANYCRHMDNGVFYSDTQKTSAEVSALLRDPNRYNALSENAVATWQNAKTYAEDFLDACEEQAGDRNGEHV